jgi:hypothetical protein
MIFSIQNITVISGTFGAIGSRMTRPLLDDGIVTFLFGGQGNARQRSP